MQRFRAAGLLALSVLAAFAQTPTVNEGGVANAANFAQPAPGSLVAIFGTNFASSVSLADTIPLSTRLGDVSVTFNSTAAPLHFVAQAQINAQLPWNIGAGAATVVVTRGGASSQSRTVQVATFSPGVYTFPGTGVGPAIVVNFPEGTVAQPEGSIPGIRTEPARIGGALIIYANGLGPVDNPVPTGDIPRGVLSSNTTPPRVLIGGVEAQVIFSGLSQFVGVNQVNVIVPAGTPTGSAIPLQLRVGDITTSNMATIAVRSP